MRKIPDKNKLPTWQQSFLHQPHNQPISNSFSMGKHHSSPRGGGKQRGHITQPTRGRGV